MIQWAPFHYLCATYQLFVPGSTEFLPTFWCTLWHKRRARHMETTSIHTLCISNHLSDIHLFWQTQALFTSCPASVSWKLTPWHMSLKGVNKFLPVHSTILDQNGQNSEQTSIFYRRAYIKFYLHLLHFYQMWISFSTGVVNENWCFTKNKPTKCHTSCSDIN
jgi:hypothetical protein